MMDSRLIKQPKAFSKPLLLKDYLLDDMSSCSSSGFKSFPRRQCCATTVRFLIDLDHSKKRNKKFPGFCRIQTAVPPKASAKCAALRSIISAVKRFPSASESSPVNKNLLRRLMFVPRNLSRKILEKGSFWKRGWSSSRKQIGRRTSLDQAMIEGFEASEIPDGYVTAAERDDGGRKGSGPSASDECASGDSVPTCGVTWDLPGAGKDVEVVGPPQNGDVSTASTTSTNASSTTTDACTKNKQWLVSEDKEQSSPVSVLECPFGEDDDTSSPYRHRLDCTDGTQKKMKRVGRLQQVDPVSLSNRFASYSMDSNDESPDENRAQQIALDLLEKMENTLASSPGFKMKADKLLLDFFLEKIIHSRNPCGPSLPEEILDEAENWVNDRNPSELYLGWEVPRNQVAYVKDMDKAEEWGSFDRENDAVALEVEAEVLDSLMNELLVDISSNLPA